MSDTPRTDEAEIRCIDEPVEGLGMVEVDFARNLERELAAMTAERDRLREQITTMRSSIETAWAIIANASGGDWDKQSVEWREAAGRWRDEAQPYTPNTGCDCPDCGGSGIAGWRVET